MQKLLNRLPQIQCKGDTRAMQESTTGRYWLQSNRVGLLLRLGGGGRVKWYSKTLSMFYPSLFNSNNFSVSVTLAEVCALLSAILVSSLSELLLKKVLTYLLTYLLPTENHLNFLSPTESHVNVHNCVCDVTLQINLWVEWKNCFPFTALTLFVGRQERHPAREKPGVCW